MAPSKEKNHKCKEKSRKGARFTTHAGFHI